VSRDIDLLRFSIIGKTPQKFHEEARFIRLKWFLDPGKYLESETSTLDLEKIFKECR